MAGPFDHLDLGAFRLGRMGRGKDLVLRAPDHERGEAELAQHIGEERLLTGPEPGITRDAIAIDWRWEGRAIRLVDTAGMRRRARVEARLERLSVADTLRTIRFAGTVVLVIDALEPFGKQDLTIANLVAEEGRALVLAANKWDAVADKPATMRHLRDRITASLAQLHGVQLVPISGLAGSGLDALMKAVVAADAVWNKRLPTPVRVTWFSGGPAQRTVRRTGC